MRKHIIKDINDSVANRLDEIMTSDKFSESVEEIYHDLEDRLAEDLRHLNEQEKKDLIEDLRNHVYEHVFKQNIRTYHMGFKDGLKFFVDDVIPTE